MRFAPFVALLLLACANGAGAKHVASTKKKFATVATKRASEVAAEAAKRAAEEKAHAAATRVKEAESLDRPITFDAPSHELSLDEFLSFETYIFDCDGVIWGISDADGLTSVKTINKLLGWGKRVMFVTNNSNKRRSDFVAELERRKIDFGGRTPDEKLDMMLSASFTTAHYLKEHMLKRPFVITSDKGVLEELQAAGITDYFATITEDGRTAPGFESPLLAKDSIADVLHIIAAHPHVDSIVVGWDTGLTARKVGTAINYIKWHEDLHRGDANFRDMPIIACSGDAGGVFGEVLVEGKQVKFRAIGNGAMADIIARSFDPPREWLDMGKPSEALLEMLRNKEVYNVDLSKALMVGDTIQTDIVFGNKGGMKTLLVLTGVTTQYELDNTLEASDSLRKPNFVLPKLGAFIEQGLI